MTNISNLFLSNSSRNLQNFHYKNYSKTIHSPIRDISVDTYSNEHNFNTLDLKNNIYIKNINSIYMRNLNNRLKKYSNMIS